MAAAELAQVPPSRQHHNADLILRPVATEPDGATSIEDEGAKERHEVEVEQSQQAQAMQGSCQALFADSCPLRVPGSCAATQPAPRIEPLLQPDPHLAPSFTHQRGVHSAAVASSLEAERSTAVSQRGLLAPDVAQSHPANSALPKPASPTLPEPLPPLAAFHPANGALPEPASPTLPAPLPPLADFNKVQWSLKSPTLCRGQRYLFQTLATAVSMGHCIGSGG